jgi:AcrR family transcriptional regulator
MKPAQVNVFDRDEMRQQKLDAVRKTAARAFNKKGFSNTTMDDVAAMLNVSKPTLYQFFKSKQELLFSCHMMSMDNGESGLALAAAHKGTGLERLVIYLKRYMTGILDDLGACPVLTDMASLAPDNRKKVVDRRKKISRATQEIIEQGMRDGSISVPDAKLATLFVLGATNWIFLWYREDGPNTPEQIVDAFSQMLANGLSAGNFQMPMAEPQIAAAQE